MSTFGAITLPQYCERLTDGFFAEPINLFTNLLFILAAFFALRLVHRSHISNKTYLKIVASSIALIGVGSFIFHAVQNQFTILLDGIPIYIFISSALLFMLNKLTNSWRYAIGIVSTFAALLVTASITVPSDFLNGSIRHVLILLAAIVLAVFMYKKYGRTALWLLPVIGLYVTAIAARSIDNQVCAAIPIGTHFAWHCLNALVCYFVVVFLVKLSKAS